MHHLTPNQNGLVPNQQQAPSQWHISIPLGPAYVSSVSDNKKLEMQLKNQIQKNLTYSVALIALACLVRSLKGS